MVIEYQIAWGKLNASGSKHPLMAHMLDVAACFAAVTQLHSVRKALDRVAGRELTNQDLARLDALAFLHDVGKANAGFQAKQWLHAEKSAPTGWPHTAGHTGSPAHAGIGPGRPRPAESTPQFPRTAGRWADVANGELMHRLMVLVVGDIDKAAEHSQS